MINDHYTFKNVDVIFQLKNRFTCNSFNLIYLVIGDTWKEEHIEQTEKGKIRLRDRVRVYVNMFDNHNTKFQKVEEHLRVCLMAKFIYFRCSKCASSREKIQNKT